MTRAHRPLRTLGWAITLIAAAATGAACARGDTAPPIATVSVTPGKTRVPIGGPVDFAYRFEVASGASLSADYAVFVQIEDEEGDVFWSDDHVPPTPTSTWQPGQVVEYTRSIFVPPHSRTGDATVRIGLYRDDERLPLQGPDEADRQTGARSYRVAALQIAPESERVFLIRRSGWHPEEFPEGSAAAWSWTQRSALLAFQNPRSDVLFFLEYDARPDVFPDGPQTVTIRAGGEPVDTFRADTGDRRLRRVSIPAATLGQGDMAEVQIEVDRAFVPANLPAGGRDSRELGIRVYQTFVDVR